MNSRGWVSIAIVIAFITLATINRIGLVDLVTPGANGDSTATASASGLETLSNRVTMLRGCSDREFMQWVEATDLWGCSNTLLDSTVTTPDINGGTWNGTVDGSSAATGITWTDLGTVTTADTTTAGITFSDNVFAAFGSNGDVPFVLNSAGLAANAELGGVIVGTSVYANAIPANSAIVSNVTADGDIVFFANTGGNSIEAMRIDASARSLIVPSVNDRFTPTIAFGDGDSGWYEVSDDNLRLSVGETIIAGFDTGGIFVGGNSAGNPDILAEIASATNPVYSFITDTDTGGGRAGANQYSLIAGGNEGIRIIGAGDIDLTPTANTDASASPFLVQNVSQNDTPGTTVNGQIRLWEDANAGGGASDGRILYQINGTTYQLNADAGLTFTNNPLILARDKALFTAGHAQWQLDRVDQADDEFLTFSTSNPALNLTFMAPEWSVAYLDHLTSQYDIARASREEGEDDSDIPYVPTVAELKAENPWPDPNTYTIADATIDETVSFRNSTQFVVGDPMVLVVDRLKYNAAAGENWGVHAVPSTLSDEFIWLLQNDATFLNDVKTLLRVR